MSDFENPYLNNGMPLNDGDLTKDAANSKSELFASLQFIKKVRALKKEMETKDGVQPTPTQTTNTASFDAINSYIKKEEPVVPSQPAYTEPVVEEKKDEYISYDYRNEPDPQENFESFDQSMENQPQESSEQPMPQEFNVASEQGQEQPAYVVGEKPKKGKNKAPKSSLNDTYAQSDIKSGRKVAWLAYILFFIPLMFAGKNPFVRFHANEGLEINIIDLLGAGLIVAGYFVKVENQILQWVLVVGLALGIVLIALTTLTKFFMIILALCGKAVQTPWLWKTRIIK